MIHIDVNTKDLNTQITYVLFLQAVIPFVTEVLPGGMTSLPLVLGTTCRWECYIACWLYSWMAVLNPIQTLLLIKPYRSYVLKPFSRTRVGDISTQPSSLHPPMLTPRPSTQRISICSHRISISSQSSRQRGSPLDGHHRFVFSNNGELHVQCRCN